MRLRHNSLIAKKLKLFLLSPLFTIKKELSCPFIWHLSRDENKTKSYITKQKQNFKSTLKIILD